MKPANHRGSGPDPIVKRVCIVGPESTGKSTLCDLLAAEFETIWVPEYARTYAAAKQAPLQASDVIPIAKGHFAAEEALVGRANKLLFVDTDVTMTMIYSRIYYGLCPPWVRDLAERKTYHLYLVTAPDVPWIADPLRDLPERRDEFFQECVRQLQAKRRRYVILRGSWEERFKTAVREVEALLDKSYDAGPGDLQ